MTAIASLLTREARARLAERVRELDELAQLMRQRGGLAEAPEPAPLHRQRGARFSTESTTSLSTTERTTTL